MSAPCTFPIANKFAHAATPKLCNRPGGLLSRVPYVDDLGIPQHKFQLLCIKHACECAVWNLTHDATPEPFTQAELDEMVNQGADRALLTNELTALDLYRPCTTPTQLPEQPSP